MPAPVNLSARVRFILPSLGHVQAACLGLTVNSAAFEVDPAPDGLWLVTVKAEHAPIVKAIGGKVWEVGL